MEHGPCECPAATATCPRYGYMKGRKRDVCLSEDGPKRQRLLAAYSRERSSAPAKRVKREGPGTELSVLLASFGAKMQNCNCEGRAKQMNEWGVPGCRERREEILAWLRESASQQTWLQWTRVAVSAATQGYLSVEELFDEAMRRAERQQHMPLKWAYGVTTVPGRRSTLLPKTLQSLANAGFRDPMLFVDGDCDGKSWFEQFGLQATYHSAPVRAYGNWVLAMLELFAKNPYAQRYALFQDDIQCVRNLREYLERVPYPENGYCNLYTFPQNQKLAPATTGWFVTQQRGLGGLGLVFDKAAVTALFTHPDGVKHLWDRPHDEKRGHKALDGGVVSALNKAGVQEHCHNPSLVQHTGQKASTVGNAVHPLAVSFPGEDYDALELLR